jgi:sugar diacid utilization regulator
MTRTAPVAQQEVSPSLLSAAPARPARAEGRRRARWSRVIVEFVTAAAEGTQAVADTTVRAAGALLAAESVALVRWQDGYPVVLAAKGERAIAVHPRPPEGSSCPDGRPVAAVSVDPRTDLVVSRVAPIEFDDSDLESLRALGALVGWANGGRASDVLLRRFATRVVASLELDEVLVSTADAASQLLRAEITGVLLRDATGSHLEMRCTIGNTRLDTARLRILPGQGLAGRVLESGVGQRLDDYSTDPRSAPEFLALSDIEGTCSAIAVPLPADGGIIGVLCGWRRRRVPFTDEDVSLFESFAEWCGGAIHNASRFETERTRARQFEAAHQALDERHLAAERDLRVHAELTRIATEGEDVGAVVQTVSELTRSPAVVLTDDGRVLGSCAPGAAGKVVARLTERVRTALPAAAGGQHPVAVGQDDGSWLLLARVRAAGITFGHLALALAEPPTPGDHLAAEQAAVVCALMLAREEAAATATRRLQSEFVWDLLEGRLPDSVEAGVRARHLGMGFALPARVVAIQVDGLAQAATTQGWTPEQLERARGAGFRLISQTLEDAGVRGAVLARRADLFTLVVPCARLGTLATARRLADALAAIGWPDGVNATVGIGGGVECMAGLPGGWREARLARSAVGASGKPEIFEDLGVLQFLLAPTSREDLDGFAHRQLGPLLDYDSTHGTELMRTVASYLSAGCSTRRTAELLCIHHRTVSYRLSRAAELTGLRLDDQEDCFRVQLACKILALGG